MNWESEAKELSDTLIEPCLASCMQRLPADVLMDSSEFADWLMRELGDQLTQTEAAQAERHWEERI